MGKLFKILLIAVGFFTACPGYQSKSDRLRRAIQEFHTLLKFREYLRATDYVIPFYRQDFINMFSGSSVRIEDYEIRGLKSDGKDINKMEITVRLLLRPVNSMTIKTVTIVERWVYAVSSWKLVNIRKLPKVKRRRGDL